MKLSAPLEKHLWDAAEHAGRLCRLNLAVHGLEGEIKHGGNINSYYDDPHDANGRFDFVIANPTTDVKAVSDSQYLVDTLRVSPDFADGNRKLRACRKTP